MAKKGWKFCVSRPTARRHIFITKYLKIQHYYLQYYNTKKKFPRNGTSGGETYRRQKILSTNRIVGIITLWRNISWVRYPSAKYPAQSSNYIVFQALIASLVHERYAVLLHKANYFKPCERRARAV